MIVSSAQTQKSRKKKLRNPKHSFGAIQGYFHCFTIINYLSTKDCVKFWEKMYTFALGLTVFFSESCAKTVTPVSLLKRMNTFEHFEGTKIEYCW